jgi:hypothetical protein
MADEDKKPAAAAGGAKKKHFARYGSRNGPAPKLTYVSNVDEVKNATFEVGSSSDPARYSNALKTIENYIQRTYKMPDDIVKTIQNMTRQTFKYPDKPKKEDSLDSQGNLDKDLYTKWKYSRGKKTGRSYATRIRNT